MKEFFCKKCNRKIYLYDTYVVSVTHGTSNEITYLCKYCKLDLDLFLEKTKLEFIQEGVFTTL